MKRIIAPSLLAADLNRLDLALELVQDSPADWLHFDVMDGRFVPNISFGFPLLKTVKKYFNKPVDVHLMIVEPEKYIEAFAKQGADILTIHYEASPHLHRSLQQIRSLGIKAGVALNPHTPVSVLENILPMADLILLMSVNPGFGGQSFIEQTYDKIRQLKGMMHKAGYAPLIEIDGGVNLDNGDKLLEAGADVLVAGSSIFKSADPLQVIKSFKENNLLA